ncbi:unnamed protein product [Thelazia callipaeda]|uniref:Ubiquinol-cytochrome-c reductase complex assembly factor 3 n=1 Tax=Thelazia callipaeda TaxID=103827 RepID=A0A0N5DBF0_THECL|nr:unnamed protein product [Thelazia callipaeda]
MMKFLVAGSVAVSVWWIPQEIEAMRLDPERLAARLRIEQEIQMDNLLKMGRNRRQLATPKEISISVSNNI